MKIQEIINEIEKGDYTIHDIIAEMHQFSLKTIDYDPKKQHVCIAIPINREITAESFSSLMQLYSHLNKHYQVSFTTSIATYLHEGRTLIVKNAYEINKSAPIDYVIWLDSDMVYTVQDFEKSLKMMKKKNLDFLSALYFTKRSKACKPVYLIKTGEDYKLAENYPPNSLLRVDGVGFGFFLCKASALFKLHEKYGNKLFKLENDNNGRMVGEDVIFSRSAYQEGYKLYVWTDICVGHEGGIISRPHFHATNSQEILDKIQWEKKAPLIDKITTSITTSVVSVVNAVKNMVGDK